MGSKMKAIEILKRFRFKYQGCQTNLERELTEAIDELEEMLNELERLKIALEPTVTNQKDLEQQ